jgi:hypothetical protein
MTRIMPAAWDLWRRLSSGLEAGLDGEAEAVEALVWAATIWSARLAS